MKTPSPRRITLYAQHVEDWTDCRRCSLQHGRQHVVFARGKVPADILFMGESPGDSEDTTGVPFSIKAPAGWLLERIVANALEPVQDARQADGKDPLRWCFYNLVGCYPTNEAGAKSSPELPEIKACRPKVEEFVALCRPRLVVLVGEKCEKNTRWLEDVGIRTLAIRHPAWILRCTEGQQVIEFQRATVAVNNAAEELD